MANTTNPNRQTMHIPTPDMPNPSVTEQTLHDGNTPPLTKEQLKHLIDNPGHTIPPTHGIQAPGMQGASQDPVQTLLTQLHDIKTPDPIGYWPLAIGWWLVIALVFALLSSGLWLAVKWFKNTHYKRVAKKHFAQLSTRRDLTDQELLTELITLLKRTFFSGDPLSRQWLSIISGSNTFHCIAKNMVGLPNIEDLKLKIDHVMYQANTSLDDVERSRLIEFTEKAIKKHKKISVFTPQGDQYAPV